MLINILGAEGYDYKKENGDQIKGGKLHCLFDSPNAKNQKGSIPRALPCTYDVFQSFSEPGQYIAIGITFNAKNEIRITGIQPSK
ncbi:hypothetical protein C0431_06975 [bacterium]|nr:hypothetical protein [bacterium]